MAARKAVEKELSREMIIDVAHDLFVEDGYQHTSMRKIAKVLGYSHGAIYYHFKNKAELFYAMVEQDFAMINAEIDQLMKLDIEREQKLEELLLGFIRFGLTYPNHYEIMFLTKDKDLQYYATNAPDQSYHNFATTIATLTDHQLEVKKIWSIFLMLHGFVAHYCRTGYSFDDLQSAVQTHVQLIMNILKD
ncbi:transcriptional regulator [Gracilibacillus boraciitolerans JCM 21714]|uniref:Transcriptional regulator n=1 Tax=Gracilibacillus boraciitolerans JCM 21714 TaxID=1298598 RepID=W4VNP7_9BACI|nr:TetR/AcrR family transcriptional regulator [Gracilibacillus boraciitolerans]GAE94990.1 transcriptional regulator [Gracilibacillus boraciitolerans JCM 21714]